MIYSCLIWAEAALIDEEKRVSQNAEIKPDIDFTSLYTLEKLKDLIVDDLAHVEIIICGKIKKPALIPGTETTEEVCFKVPKYSEEAAYVARFVPLSDIGKSLTISLSDLSPRLLRELHSLEKEERRAIITAVGKRLLKIYYPHYFKHIGDLIKIEVRA